MKTLNKNNWGHGRDSNVVPLPRIQGTSVTASANTPDSACLNNLRIAYEITDFMLKFLGASTATGYGLDGPVSISYYPQRPDGLWDPPSLLSNGSCGQFPWSLSGQAVKLTTHLHLVPRSRMWELYLQLPYVFIS
jgi:hypothetical protein